MERLKDCPFCGGRALFEGFKVMEEMDGDTSKAFVECQRCGARGPAKITRFDVAGSVKIEAASMLWNARRGFANKAVNADLAALQSRRENMTKSVKRKEVRRHGEED